MRFPFNEDNSDNRDISLDGQIVSMNDTFWYLTPMLQSNRGIDEDTSHRLKVGWVNGDKHLVFSMIRRS
jgi:hypothetical protein